MIGTLLKASCYFTNICSACTCSAATWLFATPCSLNHLPAPQKQKHTHECGRWALLTLGLCNLQCILAAQSNDEVRGNCREWKHCKSSNPILISFWFTEWSYSLLRYFCFRKKKYMVYMGQNHKHLWYINIKSAPGPESEAVCLFHTRCLFLESQYQSSADARESSRIKPGVWPSIVSQPY